MLQSVAPKTYWAKDSSCGDNTSCYSGTTEQLYEIFTATVTDDDANGTYKCTGNVSVSVSGADSIKADDMAIKFDGLTSSPAESTDLHDIVEESNSKTFPVDFTITGNDNHSIKAGVSLTNSSSADQGSYLAEASITIEIDASGVTCSLQGTGA